METKHTPGPWTVHDSGGAYWGVSYVRARSRADAIAKARGETAE